MGNTVAVLGAGALGTAIAARLGRCGHDVRIWNHHTQRARDAARDADGVGASDTAGEAVAGADVVLTVLPTGDVVAEVMDDVLDDVTGVWVQTSTVGPQAAQQLADLARRYDVAYLDAPVSGSTQPAEQGELIWLVSGAPEVIERARPVLDSLGSTVQHVGTSGVEGSALKLAVNAWMTGATVLMGDVLDLCDALHVDHDTLRDALGAGPLAMPYALQKSQLMDDGAFDAGFAVRNALKDLHLAAESAPPSPLLREVAQRLQRTVDAGHGDDDVAAAGRTP